MAQSEPGGVDARPSVNGTDVRVVVGAVAFGVLIVAVLLAAASAAPKTSAPTYQATPLGLGSATVTDPSVPFAASEAEALVPRGLLGEASYGRIGRGCQVAVRKTTNRAALVTLVRCPESDTTTSPTSLKQTPVVGSLAGWVARSALDLR